MLQALETVLQVVAAGVTVGLIYGLMCVGLGMIFGVMRIINFAQGEFLMLGMYATFFLASYFSDGSMLPWVPIFLVAPAAIIVFVVGSALYVIALRPIVGRRSISEDGRHNAQLVITLGLSLVLQSAALMIFGSVPRSVFSSYASSALVLGPLIGDEVTIFLNKARLIASAISILVAIFVSIFVAKTKIGRSIRATADDKDAAMYSGIDVTRVYIFSFGTGAAITAAAGGLLATTNSFQPYVGLDFVIIMYAAVILGGVGSIKGAFFGGLIVGIVQQASTLILPHQLQGTAIFVVLLATLLFFPRGLFGRDAERV
ncbi:MAG: branched-chain amino acid ABC transporter permease [Pseudolabrys sp.]|nr:branched-chain amino acid ABC transporter permease [Pseudolabrys sp.]